MTSASHAFIRKLRSTSLALGSVIAREPLPVIASAFKGRTSPMPEVAKRATLRRYSERFQTRIFVETGTFLGETLEYLLPFYDRLYSIELAPQLHRDAVAKFAAEPRVKCLHGDSAELLGELIPTIDAPALIWLDAHYSGGKTALGDEETPIIRELQLVFARQTSRHVILIDDAREFGGNPAYPPLTKIAQIAAANGYSFENRFDIIRLLPPWQRRPAPRP